MNTYLVLSDLQIPWHDKPVLDLVLRFAVDIEPDGVILNGDVLDCYQISTFDKDPRRIKQWSLKHEQLEAQWLMAALGEIKSVKDKWWLGGNHEDRWRKVEWKFPQLDGMFKDLPGHLDMARWGFRWQPYGGRVMLGKLMVTHGSLVRQHSGATARAHYEKYGTSVLVGHSHRLGSYLHTNIRGQHGAWENGCLCRLDPEYVQNPNWQQGFSVVQVDKGGWFNVQQVPVLNRRVLYYGGERWER